MELLQHFLIIIVLNTVLDHQIDLNHLIFAMMKNQSEISQQDLNQEKWPASGLIKMAGGSSCSATSILLPEMLHHKLAHEGPVTTD